MARSSRFIRAAATLVAICVASALAGPATAIPPPGPATPTELIATNDTSSITLSWTQPTWGFRPTHFRVYEGSTVVARNTTTRVRVPGLGLGSTHTFQVTAVAASGLESARSVPITRQVWVPGVDPSCRPYPPSGLRAFDLSSTALSLGWDPLDPPGQVRVSGGGPALLTDLSHARLGGLKAATTYTFNVARADCRGQYHAAEITVTTPDGRSTPPGQPTAVTAGTPSATAVKLSWTAPPGAGPSTWYHIYRGGSYVSYTSTTSIELTGLWRDNTYPFTVATLDAGGESATSAPVRVQTQACDPGPPAPTAVTASVRSASSVALHWVSEIEATSFTVYDGPSVVATVRVPSAMITGLASASVYRFRVVANLPGGCGATPSSAIVSATTLPGPRPRPRTPIGLRPVPLPPRPDPLGTVVLAWTQPPSPDPVRGYRVYEGATVLGTSTTTSFSTRLPPATTHLVSVVSVDAYGNESRQSVPVLVTASFVLPP